MNQQKSVHDDRLGESGNGEGSAPVWAVLGLVIAILACSSGCANLDVPLVSTHDSTVQKAFAAQARTDDIGDLANIDDPALSTFIFGGLVGYVAAFPATVALAPVTWPISKVADDDSVLFAPNYALGFVVGAAVAAPVFLVTLPWRLLGEW